ncbi:MAG: PIN domain-containing protein [Desulfobacterales bacterium]|jgi:predicted nucleic acid-binding protein|nr:PIN domain-containing protein [Desulfobacterales bacterium]
MNDFNIQPDSTYFVDTNIWLYSFIQSQNKEKTEIARTIIKECEIVISTQIINEMCVNLIKKVDFSEGKILNLIESLYKKYTVFELSQDILLKASKIRANQSFSFWDSVVAASALDCDADYLISEDMQDGFNLENKLTIINPFT